MNRLTLGLLALPVLLCSTNAIAASCDGSIDPPSANAVTYHWDDWVLDLFDIPGGSNTQTCGITAPLAIPDGAVGYYTVDNRGFVYQPDGETTDSTIAPDFAAADTKTLTEEDTDFAHTVFIPSGPRAGFDGEVSLTLNGVADGDGLAGLDSTDIAMFYTTTDALEGSLDDLAAGQTGLVTHLGATADLLVGGNKPLDVEGAEIGVIGGKGSYMLGVAGHYSLADGFSLLGGVSLVSQGGAGATGKGVLGAVAARYVDPMQTSGFRLFGEGGLNVAALSTTFSRTYLSSISATPLTIESSTAAGLAAAYLRGGAIVELDDRNATARP